MQRAAYDAERTRIENQQWRIFNKQTASRGLGAEKEKRQAIFSMLYLKRMREADQPGVPIQEMVRLRCGALIEQRSWGPPQHRRLPFCNSKRRTANPKLWLAVVLTTPNQGFVRFGAACSRIISFVNPRPRRSAVGRKHCF